MEADASFGAWIVRQRKTLDLTREQLARCAGCSVSALRKIESDERRPSRQLAELLADCLQVSPDQRSTFLQVARGQLRVERLATLTPRPAPDLVVGHSLPRPGRPLPIRIKLIKQATQYRGQHRTQKHRQSRPKLRRDKHWAALSVSVLSQSAQDA